MLMKVGLDKQSILVPYLLHYISIVCIQNFQMYFSDTWSSGHEVVQIVTWPK